MASLPELFPACEIRTPMLVTKTAVAAKSPAWAAHRCEIIASSTTPLFFYVQKRGDLCFGLALSINLYIANPEKGHTNRDIHHQFLRRSDLWQ
jgi:hypothetical protein